MRNFEAVLSDIREGFDIRKFYDAYDMTEDEIRICDFLYERTEIQCVEIRELRRVLQEKLKQVRRLKKEKRKLQRVIQKYQKAQTLLMSMTIDARP